MNNLQHFLKPEFHFRGRMWLGRLPESVDLGRTIVDAATGATTDCTAHNRTSTARRLQQCRIIERNRPQSVLEVPLNHRRSCVGSGRGHRMLLHLQCADNNRLSIVVSAIVEQLEGQSFMANEFLLFEQIPDVSLAHRRKHRVDLLDGCLKIQR